MSKDMKKFRKILCIEDSDYLNKYGVGVGKVYEVEEKEVSEDLWALRTKYGENPKVPKKNFVTLEDVEKLGFDTNDLKGKYVQVRREYEKKKKEKAVVFGDIQEENGKTIRENNMEMSHKIPLDTLVELIPDEDYEGPEDNIRLYVIEHTRDCDGTPLYNLGLKHQRVSRNEQMFGLPKHMTESYFGPYSEECLKVILS